ncbi:hypothetical protein H2200_011006 [Cladophialophora chaetospira]|uniref:Carboxylic ester hydrolase n=1 Tax=Cladophialophora chaetospira TaxID=386627 RepID=A0AA38WZX4_9EURO|nr:hypothetical protein H2200_011006 [Cladophialophora chaetospira]
MKPETFTHPTLGPLIGVARGDDIVQFRGIPYAEIPARFRQSTLRSSLPQGPFDARHPGPICPQTTLPFPDFWSGPLAADGIELSKPRPEEFACLNLNITAPRVALSGDHNVPVLVYIHGGAFVVGSTSVQVAGREITDGTNLVRSSIALGAPIIVVSINYRVGPLGFLASDELVAYNRQHNEPAGNYGLHDQRQALEWVARSIAGFGGDPENVTIEGGSAGGASCHFQSLFPNRKFKRAILSSGTCIGLGAMSLDWHQKTFDVFKRKFVGETGIVEALQAVPADVFTNEHVGVFYNPYVDGDWIPERTVSALRNIQHPPDFMIGSCAFEQDATLTVLGAPSPDPSINEDECIRMRMLSLLSTLGLTVKPESVLSPPILQTYNIADTVDTPSKQLSAWAEFVAELLFRIPPLHVALNHAGSKLYLYDFQATNPFSGLGLGYKKANHAISDIFLFDPAGDLVEEKHRAEYGGGVRHLQEEWIKFCYGRLDWEPFDAADQPRLGPVYTFKNNGKGKKHEKMSDVVGPETLRRWKAVLAVSER